MPGTSVLRALLTLGATLRLTRLVTVDDLGQWWLKDPIDEAAERWYFLQQKRKALEIDGHTANFEEMPVDQPWWWKYRSGLDCGWCVGFWLGVAVLLSEKATHGTRAESTWRFAAAAFTLNYAAARLDALLDTIEESDDASTD